MKYMLMLFGGACEPTPERSAEWFQGLGELMMGLDAELQVAGELVAGHGLVDASKAQTVRFVGGAPVPTDGPFAEVKEALAGYWVIDSNEDRALEIASRVVVHPVPDGGPPGHERQPRPVTPGR
jgi:hypothetical protein